MTNRRDLLLLGLGFGLASAATARADAPSLSKDQVGYQDVPKDGKVCAQCVYFEFKPATGAAPSSRCQMVAGPISPSGWCEIWTTKV